MGGKGLSEIGQAVVFSLLWALGLAVSLYLLGSRFKRLELFEYCCICCATGFLCEATGFRAWAASRAFQCMLVPTAQVSRSKQTSSRAFSFSGAAESCRCWPKGLIGLTLLCWSCAWLSAKVSWPEAVAIGSEIKFETFQLHEYNMLVLAEQEEQESAGEKKLALVSTTALLTPAFTAVYPAGICCNAPPATIFRV